MTINGDSQRYLDALFWPGLIGMAYIPSVVPPVGRTAQGLPVGVQIVTAHGHDRLALAIAKWLAQRAGYAPPSIATS